MNRPGFDGDSNFLREWSHEQSKPSQANFFPKSESALFGWCASSVASIRHCGHRLNHCADDRLFEPDAIGWVKRDQIDNGEREGVSTSERERLKTLERENKELRRANEILKLASAFFAQAELDRRLKS